MSPSLLLTALSALSAGSTRPEAVWILVPSPEGSACFRSAELTTQVELTPGLVSSRTRAIGEELALERTKLGADWALEVRQVEGAGPTTNFWESPPPVFEVTLLGTGAPRTARGAHPSQALAKVWPPNAPPLSAPIRAPNEQALKATCQGRSEEAMAWAGAALTPLLTRLLSFPRAPIKGSLFQRWARASADFSVGNSARGLAGMRKALAALEQGEWVPTWRRLTPPPAGRPSALTMGSDGLFVFAAGRLNRLEQETGMLRWSLEVDRIEPRPIVIDGGPLIAVSGPEFRALDPASGETLWVVAVASAHNEVAVRGNRLFFGSEDQVIAVDLASGERLWTSDLDEEAVAGPAAIGASVAVPLVTSIRVFDGDTGRRRRTIRTPDEVSAPLLATRRGYLWVLLGSDRVQQIDPRRGTVRVRLGGLPGAYWPPTLMGERLVLATRAQKRRRLHLLDALSPRGRRMEVDGTGPVVRLSDFSGILHLAREGRRLLGRDGAFQTSYDLKLPGPARTLTVYGDRAIGGLDDGIVLIDTKKGRVLHRVPLEAPVIDVAVNRWGGATNLRNGVIYGWPSPGDPQHQVWLAHLRRELARAALAAKRYGEARIIAAAVLAREPMDFTARELEAEAVRGEAPQLSLSQYLKLLRDVPDRSPPGLRALAAMAKLGVVPTQVGIIEGTDDDFSPFASAPDGPPPDKLGFKVLHSLARPEGPIYAGRNTIAALSPEGSRVKWRLKLPGPPIAQVEPDGPSLLVWTRTLLHRVGPSGKLEGRVRLSGFPKAIARPPDSAIAIVDDGQLLTAIDVRAARLLGRVQVPGLKRLSVRGGKVLARLAHGKALIIDPARGLGGP